ARTGHTATLISGGKVLITGGADMSGNLLSSAEIYDPAMGVFTPAGNLNTARSNHQATLLSDGRVLITGGGSGESALASAEIFDPEKGVFLAAGQMTAPRKFHAATLLENGDVLIAGGSSGKFSPEATLSNAEIFDRRTGTFASTGNMTVRRYGHAATRLADGRILITGGSTGREWKDRTASAETFDPNRKLFLKTENMSLQRFNHQAATLLLADGRVLVAGAGARVEIFDPASGTFSSTAGNVGTGRIFSSATLLPNGEVLITGGYNFAYPPTASAWLYSP
ncbi:MAG: kelch-like protein, partial [Acidobacteria bacterium]|nr:kelch-like protein [Acidobacteriota bacterium]